ncbi:MAG TPA: hypothetical protein VK718_00070 [Ferruginibacter sp.]|jgi:hypothetical protein|nr:hypothetical protein [Ferruginibacter sp.]
MKEENKHIIYTAADIHRYLTGKLTVAEMHAMEKAALSDPLLADAMDGFAGSASFKNEEEFTRTQHDLHLLKKKITGISYPKDNTWWKVAAAAVLLIGSCFTFYTITNHRDKQKQADILQQPILKAPEPKADTVIKQMTITTVAERPAMKIKLTKKNNADKVEYADKDDASKKEATTFTDNAATATAPVTSSESNEGQENNFAKKRMTSFENNKFAVTHNKILLRTDTSGNNSRAASRVEIIYKKDAEPLIGWVTYLHYLETQLSYSTYDDGKPVTGEMIVEFKIDANYSIPDNFQFERSIDADVNNAVKQVIINGPQWKKNETTPITGIIKLKIIF